MWHAKGVMYGDMAQLETGTSANRCNLIDNGDFHLGTTEGFEKNESNTDGLSEVYFSNYLTEIQCLSIGPVQTE